MEKRKYKKRNLWTPRAESLLMKLWAEKVGELRSVKKNAHIVKEMASILQQSDVFVTAAEVKSKIQNLTSKYRNEKVISRVGGTPSNWQYYNDVHKILGKFKRNIQYDEDEGSSMDFECVTLPTSSTSRIKSSSSNHEACRSLLESASKSGSSQLYRESFHSIDTKEFRGDEPFEVDMAKLDERVGFIGGGNMAFAIGSGLISRGIVKAGQVLVSGPNLENLLRWRDLGAEVTEDNYEVLDKSDIIFICVKPHVLTPCATQLRSIHEPTTKDKEKLFVSVLAGVNLKTLEESFNFIVGLKMIRTMPNTSMQVGEGCTVYTAGTYVKQQDLEKLHLMLNSLGIAQQVPESMIDAVTGVAGCGPAYVYTFIESLADGAVKGGVPRQMALQFAAQMVLGAAKTVLVTGKHPAILRDEVCSPGGSTIVGVHELEKGSFRATVINAVEMSSKRSAELGKK